MRQVLHSLAELKTLADFESFSSDTKKEIDMEKVTGYFNAEVSHYNHNKRFGFAKVSIPEGTVLNFSAKDKDGAVICEKDVPFTEDRIIEAFIHASVVASAGYERGLNVGDEIPVKIDLQEKGIQVTKIRSVNNNPNEPRIANEFLTFVVGRVKMYDSGGSEGTDGKNSGGFGFVSIDHHYKTGELLEKPVDAYFSHHLLARAQYDKVEKDDLIVLKYYTYSTGKSSVCLIMYADKAKKALEEMEKEIQAA